MRDRARRSELLPPPHVPQPHAFVEALRDELTAVAEDGVTTTFQAISRVDTPQEAEYYRNGGILPFVLRQIAS